MGKAIQLVNLTKSYGKLVAVNNVNLEIEEGEFFGLLGPNGAGKTTIIRLITGLTKPSQGKVLVSGYDMAKEPVEVKKKIGLIPETSNLYNDMNAWENLAFMARLYGVQKEEASRRSLELLELFGLKERLGSPVRQFSKGMKRRLAIALALVHKPRILLLDEPTGGLDVQSSRSIRQTLRKVNEEGATIFMTTHYIEEADQLCNRVAIINQGNVIALDTPENLRSSSPESVIEVAFDGPTRMPEEVERMCSRVVKLRDERYRLFTATPGEVSKNLEDFANSAGRRIAAMTTTKPTLEDVFVRYTGLDALAVERMEQLRQRRGAG
ncbi:MAG: ABC transporter ATP-binding protein [Candidatus Brockarchaeota archaeon]|nr:ABC transporter ATP-binding protein [Candidatus Brockarchaeota archaeon]